jgi:RNA polymerase sigma-70 factor (ECF subfamily)
MKRTEPVVSDSALVARALLGDESGFSGLVERHVEMLTRTAWRFTGNQEDAEDVVAETFLRAYSRLEEIRGVETIAPWLRTITTNLCLDGYRKKKYRGQRIHDYARAVPTISTEHDPQGSALAREAQAELSRALRQLSPRQRTAFLLFEVAGKDIKSVAEEMGCSQGTVKAQLHRARKRLKDLMGDYLARSGE